MKHSNYIYFVLFLLILIIIIYIYQENNAVDREGFVTKYYRPKYRRFRKLLNDYIFYYIK